VIELFIGVVVEAMAIGVSEFMALGLEQGIVVRKYAGFACHFSPFLVYFLGLGQICQGLFYKLVFLLVELVHVLA
jgi:hypothetical protein